MKQLLLILLPCAALAQMHPSPGPGTRAVAAPPAGIVYRGGTTNHADSSASSIATASTLNIQAGDLTLVVTGALTNSSMAVTCGADSLTEIKSWYYATDNYTVKVFAKYGSTANASATCTVTYGSASTFRFIGAGHWGGIATASALDQSSCNSISCDSLATSATSRTALNVTTTQADELLVGIAVDWDGGLTHTAANSFNIRLDGNTVVLADKVVSSTGTYPSGNFTTASPAQRYLSFFLTFKAAP